MTRSYEENFDFCTGDALLTVHSDSVRTKKDAGGQTEDGKDTAAEEQTISGIINRLGEYLVLLDENSEYHIFDFDEAVDLSGLEEGDSVTVTYTGTLDSDDPAPVAISIEKAG